MTAIDPRFALEQTWNALGGPADALDALVVSGPVDPVLPSSFPIGAMATAATGAAMLAAREVWRTRTGNTQDARLTVDDATVAFRSNQLVRVDGRAVPDVWNAFSGFYPTADARFVQLHTNFPHHLERTLHVLDVPGDRAAVAGAIAVRAGAELEDELAGAGACAALARTRDEWLAHPQGIAVRALPLLDTLDLRASAPRPLDPADRPLAGVRVVDLTRVIAGPVAARTLAAHGADVLRVSSPNLPEIDAILPDTSIGKRSAFVDARDPHALDELRELVRGADVVVQSYRPGSLDALGLGADAAAELRPDIVYVSLSAYGHAGPWRDRRGYDTLVQTASGVAWAEAEAFGAARPRHVPVSGLDHATGYFAATAAMLALAARHRHGGARHVRCSLAQTREWLDTLGRVDGVHAPAPDDDVIIARLPVIDSTWGRVTYAPPAGDLARTPARWERGPSAPGADPPRW